MKITVNQLRKIIREEVEKNLSSASPDPDVVYNEFIELRDKLEHKVPLDHLAKNLGVNPDQIDWSAREAGGMGTGLSVLEIDGMKYVTELIGDTPYKTDL